MDSVVISHASINYILKAVKSTQRKENPRKQRKGNEQNEVCMKIPYGKAVDNFLKK